MLKKRLLTMAIVAALCVSATACSSKDNNTENTQAATQATEATEAATEKYKNDVACADIEAAVAAALGESYYAAMEVPGIEDLGITSDMYTDFVYKMPMISVNVDTLIVVKAAEGRTEDVKAALNSYRDMLLNDTMQYPSNIAKIENSVIVEYGDYVAFVQLGADAGNQAVMAATEKTPDMPADELAKLESEAIAAQNKLATDAIEATLKN